MHSALQLGRRCEHHFTEIVSESTFHPLTVISGFDSPAGKSIVIARASSGKSET